MSRLISAAIFCDVSKMVHMKQTVNSQVHPVMLCLWPYVLHHGQAGSLHVTDGYHYCIHLLSVMFVVVDVISFCMCSLLLG